MILDSQTNYVYFSKLLWERSTVGKHIVSEIMNHNVPVQFLRDTRAVWARDYMPIQIDTERFIGYEYAPDYLYFDDRYVGTITQQLRVCNELEIEPKPSGLIIDGGNIVKTSKGVIMVDKVFSENPQYGKISLINRLETMLEAEILFLPWDRSEIYGHADGVAREISPGKVLMTNYHRFSKKHADMFTDILSKYFDVSVLDFDVKKQHPYNWCYINYLQVGDKVFLPQLTSFRKVRNEEDMDRASTIDGVPRVVRGDMVEEDALALARFKSLMPGCEIIPISCPRFVRDGGALNCLSWNIKIEHSSEI